MYAERDRRSLCSGAPPTQGYVSVTSSVRTACSRTPIAVEAARRACSRSINTTASERIRPALRSSQHRLDERAAAGREVVDEQECAGRGGRCPRCAARSPRRRCRGRTYSSGRSRCSRQRRARCRPPIGTPRSASRVRPCDCGSAIPSSSSRRSAPSSLQRVRPSISSSRSRRPRVADRAPEAEVAELDAPEAPEDLGEPQPPPARRPAPWTASSRALPRLASASG